MAWMPPYLQFIKLKLNCCAEARYSGEKCQRGSLDLSEWIVWFLNTLLLSLKEACSKIEQTLGKTRFLKVFQSADLAKGQIKVLNRLLDNGEKDYPEGISAGQYQKIAKVSKATATRHLSDLVTKGALVRLAGGGRSTRYRINVRL